MLLFIVIVSIVFLFASKHYSIRTRRDSAGDRETLTRFTFFMLFCSLIWLAIKFAMRFSGAVLIALMVWFLLKELVKKPHPKTVLIKK